MNLLQIVKISLKSIFAHTGRTILTLLGIIISVFAIMSVLTLGENIKSYVVSEVESFGSDVIQIEVSVPEKEHASADNVSSMAMGVQITTLNHEDAEAVGKLPNVQAYNVGLTGQGLMKYEDESDYAILLGSSHTSPKVDKAVKLAKGRFFDQTEEETSSQVVVLGSEVSESFFGEINPVGKKIKLGGATYRVVGVLEERGSVFGFNFDDMVYMPYTTLQKKILGVDHVQYITVKVDDVEKIDRTTEDIRNILRLRHDIDKPVYDDFEATTMQEALNMIGVIFDGLNILLVALATISLIVGGVGIMNIMLVSVEERGREIGIRKALGAREVDVLNQFIAESIVVSFLGAIVGVAICTVFLWILFFAINAKGFDIDFFIPLRAILVSGIFSLVAGLVFGIYPAKIASKVNPMEAIRS